MSSNTTLTQEIAEIRSHLSWVDEERRKTNRKLAEMEQQLEIQHQEISGREQRIKDLEKQLADTKVQISRQAQFDTRLSQFKDEIVLMIEQNSQRLQDGLQEADRLRRVESEMNAREFAGILKQLPDVSRLQDEMQIRQAEDARLSNLVGRINTQVTQMDQRFDPILSEVTYANETTKRHSQRLTELEGEIRSTVKADQDLRSRLEVVADKAAHVEVDIRELTEEVQELRGMTRNWTEQIQLGEYERNNRLNTWERYLAEQKSVMESYSAQWVKFNERYQEVKVHLDQLTAWREQQDIQLREHQERNRLDVNRLLSEWQEHQNENQQKWRNMEMDSQQRQAASQRRSQQYEEKLGELEEIVQQITQDKEMLWRVQSAQADALKQFPRIWLEEVERTMEQNPYRRRQPTLTPIREE
jgi:chromosome segregation ATPase